MTARQVWIERAPAKWVRAEFVEVTGSGHWKCRDTTGHLRWMHPSKVRQDAPT